MKLQVEKAALADAAGRAARALPARPVNPVLAGIRIGGRDDGTALLSAYDYDTSARAAAAATVDEPGSVLVPGKLLLEIARALPGRPVTLDDDGTRLSVTCGAANFTLPLMPIAEYPELPAMPAVAGTIGADAFAGAVAQAVVAAGRDDTLPALTGIRLELTAGTLRLAATDRYRLAVRELPWDRDDADAVALVPAALLAAVVPQMTGAAEITVALDCDDDGSGTAGFEADGLTVTTRLLSGEYPRYEQLLPSEFTATADLPAAPFTEAVKRAALVADKGTPVRLSFGDGEVLIESAGDGSEASETLGVEFDGDPLETAFAPGYLLDGVTAAGTGTVRMSFTAPARPAVITPADAGTGYRYVIMPIRDAS